MHGFVAALASEGPVRGPQHVFVNRRAVKDRTITHAILDAYSQASIKERSPEVHLLIEMPLDAVDVNVHPTKAEVRFRDQSFIHQVVRRAVADALGAAPAPRCGGTLAACAGRTAADRRRRCRLRIPPTFPSRWTRAAVELAERAGRVERAPFAGAVAEVREALYVRVPGGGGRRGRSRGRRRSAARSTLMPLGQFRDTFIVAVDDEGIAIIDQHVAHERILFERITERLTSRAAREPAAARADAGGAVGRAGGRRCWRMPRTWIAWGSRSRISVENHSGVSACPALLPREEWQRAVRALAEDLDGLDRGAAVTDALKRIAATMACHAAVKANYPLTPEKMVHILDGLRRTAYSTICPHGRPVMLRLTRRELEKRFERI